jgi:hypothetical protein
MNPLLLNKTDGKQLVIDLERVISFEQLQDDHVRINLTAGNGMVTFIVIETMAAVIQAISGGE